MTHERLAIRLMIAQSALFAAETTLIHYVGSRASLMLLALVRCVGGITLAVILARRIGFAVLRTGQLPSQLLRGAVTMLSLWVMVYSFAHLPLADATAISYTQTAFIVLFSLLVLGERVTGFQWAAAGLGICGALLIARPAWAGWNGAYLIALFGAALNALSFVLSRYLQRQDSEATTMFYSNLVPLLGNLPVLTIAELPPSMTLAWLPALLLIGPIGVYAGIVAAKHANTAVLAPYTQLRLVIALIGGVVFFRELPTVFSMLGAVLIVASCMIGSWTRTGMATMLIARLKRRNRRTTKVAGFRPTHILSFLRS